ncbi:MAG TPA: glycosyltransferase [Fibrobacteria bacterium]|nr:glycosyltransferase [Fibrobacteria bacterium]
MRILYFNYQISSFASIVRSLEYAKGAADEGHEVELCYLHPAFRPPESYYDLIAAYESPRLRVRYPPRKQAAAGAVKRPIPGKAADGKPDLRALYRQIAVSPRFIPQELKLVDRFRPDVLMARSDPTLSFMATARLRSLPLVLETDGPVEEMDRYWGVDSSWVRPLDSWRARRADALLYISEACRELWLSKRIRREKLFYTPNAAHPDRFRPQNPSVRRELRAKFGLDGNAKVIGFSGILRPWHGLDNLLAAALPLLEEDPDVRILLIGAVDGPGVLDRCGLPEAIRKERLVFTGPVPYARMGDHIDLADCLALPYAHSTLFHFSPMKLFEGMSLGKVIVAPRMGQIKEMLGDLSSPALYDPHGGVVALREALKEGLRRSSAAADGKVAGADARARIEKAHTWAHRGKVVSQACEFALARKAAA